MWEVPSGQGLGLWPGRFGWDARIPGLLRVESCRATRTALDRVGPAFGGLNQHRGLGTDRHLFVIVVQPRLIRHLAVAPFLFLLDRGPPAIDQIAVRGTGGFWS